MQDIAPVNTANAETRIHKGFHGFGITAPDDES